MPSPARTAICEVCSSEWTTRSKKARTCSPKCRAILREKEKPSPGAPQREYPVELIEKVRSLYESGRTIKEIGEELGPGYKAQRIVERYVSERRSAAKRHQSGEANHAWKGSEAGYQALHLRVQTLRGKPNRCSTCDTTDPVVNYEWANLSGRYEDVNDYARLCIPCHRRLDSARRAVSGQRTSLIKGCGEDA